MKLVRDIVSFNGLVQVKTREFPTLNIVNLGVKKTRRRLQHDGSPTRRRGSDRDDRGAV